MKTFPKCEEQGLRESPLGTLWARLRSALGTVSFQRRPRRLRLCESLSLGEKRLVAVVEYEGQRFLLGATAESVSLLQALGAVRPEETPAEGRV
jgi:flagellar biogenesis protein FliO